MKPSLTWFGLIGLTLAGWWLGHSSSASWVGLAVLLLTVIKGQWLIDQFMDLRHAPGLFRVLVSGWLVVIVGAMALLGV